MVVSFITHQEQNGDFVWIFKNIQTCLILLCYHVIPRVPGNIPLLSDISHSCYLLQLPLNSVTEEFKVPRTRESLEYRDSKDPKVSVVRTNRKWSGLGLGSWRWQKRGWGWGSGNGKIRTGQLFNASTQQDPGQGDAMACPGRGESSIGQGKNQKDGRHEAAGRLDEKGEDNGTKAPFEGHQSPSTFSF